MLTKLGILNYDTSSLENYMVLESIQANASKCIHVVDLDKNDEFKIGRGKESDIRISDISVSRLHAFLRKNSEDDELLLEDNDSKFGSLIML